MVEWGSGPCAARQTQLVLALAAQPQHVVYLAERLLELPARVPPAELTLAVVQFLQFRGRRAGSYPAPSTTTTRSCSAFSSFSPVVTTSNRVRNAIAIPSPAR